MFDCDSFPDLDQSRARDDEHHGDDDDQCLDEAVERRELRHLIDCVDQQDNDDECDQDQNEERHDGFLSSCYAASTHGLRIWVVTHSPQISHSLRRLNHNGFWMHQTAKQRGKACPVVPSLP